MGKLVKCKHCGKEIAKKAKVCPQCGGKNKQTSTFTKLVAICLVASVVGYMMTSPEERAASHAAREAAKAAKVEEKKRERAECRKNRECWIRENQDIAYGYMHLVEKRAKYQHRWESDGPRFSRFGYDEKTGHVTYQGDQVSFQNGFGAWQRQSYSLKIDPEGERLLNLSVEEGRLPEQ